VSEPPLPATPPARDDPKSAGAFRTIGEVSADTGIAPHILRYWEAHFPQLRPVTRAGGRRYYRPDDVALVRRIDRLLNVEGYTLRGARSAIAGRAPANDAGALAIDPTLLAALRRLRDALVAALRDDDDFQRSRVAANRTLE
jgi:DNA-binding transcriptional MerR regulator